jgi:hypothetical protein
VDEPAEAVGARVRDRRRFLARAPREVHPP